MTTELDGRPTTAVDDVLHGLAAIVQLIEAAAHAVPHARDLPTQSALDRLARRVVAGRDG